MAAAIRSALRPWQGIAKASLLLVTLAGTFMGGYRSGYLTGWIAGYGEITHTFEEAYHEGYRNGMKDGIDSGHKPEGSRVEESTFPLSHRSRELRMTP